MVVNLFPSFFSQIAAENEHNKENLCDMEKAKNMVLETTNVVIRIKNLKVFKVNEWKWNFYLNASSCSKLYGVKLKCGDLFFAPFDKNLFYTSHFRSFMMNECDDGKKLEKKYKGNFSKLIKVNYVVTEKIFL